MEGLAAGKLIGDQQYRYTCRQSSPNCNLRAAEKKQNASGNGTENGNKMERSANGHTVLISCNGNEMGTIF